MAKKTTKKSKSFSVAHVKKATAGIKAIARAQKKLDLEIKKHQKHLTAMYEHGGNGD